jgi:hypothetical protein
MSRGRRLTLALIASLAALGLVPRAAETATRFDPALRFKVLRTEHFRIYFHQGADRLAARLALIAELGWGALERPLGVRPPPLTHIVVADQTELSNAYATPLPYDTVVIYTSAPAGSEFDTDDWLQLVFTHEFTHILHLDRSESWAGAVRHVFGRTPIAFPNLFLPTWQIEGLAVYAESAITGEGRLHAGEFRAIVEEAARHRTLEPLDRVNGGLTDWPGGQAAYAYGSTFHQYLADRFGVEKLATLADATARRAPYIASPVFSKVFGESLGDLWRDFESAAVAGAGSPVVDEGVKRLTRHGFIVNGPRFDRTDIVYAARTPDGFPALDRIPLDGGAPARLATRYYGSTTAIGAEVLYFDQLDVIRNVNISGDLYALSRGDGRVTRLTSGARLHDPDLSPDGATIAAVQDRTGQRNLVLLSGIAGRPRRPGEGPRSKPGEGPRSKIETLIAEPDTQFNAPRWSPDGRYLAVERHRLDRAPEVVIVDVAARTVRVLAAALHTRVVMPAWLPDGRGVVAAVAPDDRPFNLFEFRLAEPGGVRQLTHTSGGATWPEISKDGKTLVFVGYTPEGRGGAGVPGSPAAPLNPGGNDLFSMPYPADAPAVALAGNEQRGGEAGTSPPTPAAETASNAGAYSPLPTLRPTSWFPFIVWNSDQVRIGAATTAIDVLGYHAYAASASWLVSGPAGAPTPTPGTPDWSVSYAYDRWLPTPFVSVSSQTSFFAGPATAAGTPSAATDRELQIEAGVVLPFVRVRASHTALATFFRAVDDYTLADGRTPSLDRAAIRAAWRTNTALTYGYSISPENGVTFGTTAELVREALGAPADATTATVDLRAYVHAFGGHHILAARAAGGVSTGDRSVGRTFVLGGAAADPSVIDFGSGAISLLRGFPSNSFAGSRVGLANLEYRFPLARPQRGVGTWPFFLHTIHAAVFADAGHAWTRDFAGRAIKTSFGAELSGNLVLGFYFPLTATVGVARGHDGSGTIPDGTVGYFRIGRSF